MKLVQSTRRAFNAGAVAVATIAAIGVCATALADQKVVKIGITLPFTGADAEDANLIKNGAMIAFDEANAEGGVAG
jgi:branched-chain amino acid transport system substrate-binding protein